MTGYDREQQPALVSLALLQELDLGGHTLLLMSDGSIDLLADEEQTPCLAEHALHLDSDETYRLFISLHEYFKQQDRPRNDERTSRGGTASRSSL